MPLVTLDEVLREVTRHPARHICTLENRPQRFCFGTRNYGDIPGMINRADGDPWDVFAPGYDRRLPFGRPYMIRSFLGYLKLSNGNHKLVVRLFVPGYDPVAAMREIERYCHNYTTKVGIAGEFVPFDASVMLRRVS